MKCTRVWQAVIAMSVMVSAAQAQKFGGNPGRTRWMQVKTTAGRVIYPGHAGMDSVASRVAGLIQWQSQQSGLGIGPKLRPIDIVLQPEVTFSNAYVQLGPYRSEFYMMAPQDPFRLGSLPWADNLAVHEFRHAQQFSNYNRGLSKLMRILGGENGQALANVMAVPDWFFEGDAVWTETRLTNQGRGRLPAFLKSYRSLGSMAQPYRYQKLRNGSLKDYVPNHYDLGYTLVGYGRQHYGDSIWQTITEDAAAFKGLFYPLQGAVKRHTGLSWKTFTQQALADFNARQKSLQTPDPEWLTPAPKRQVLDYQYPYAAADGSLIALKSGYRQIPVFVRLQPNGSESRIAVKEIGYDDYFSYNNGRIVYSALRPDARWGNRDHSIIRLLDVATGQTHGITSRGRWFSPDISADGQQVVAVEVDKQGQSRLAVLNTEGQIQDTMRLPGYFLSHPKWLAARQGEVLVAARSLQTGHMGLAIWSGAAWNWLLQPAERLVGFPVVQGDTVLYTATEGSYDGVYAQLVSTGQRWQMQQYGNGIYQATWWQGALVGSYFTRQGYRLGKASAQQLPLLGGNSGLTPLYTEAKTAAQAQASGVTTPALPAGRYRQTRGFFNLHSWQPLISQPEYSLYVLGNNVLNNTSTTLGYTWNNNENSHAIEGSFVYGGWWAQPLLVGKHTWGREVRYNADTTFVYDETKLGAGFQVPLNFSRGKHYRYMNVSATYNFNAVKWQNNPEGFLRDQQVNYLQTRVTYSSQIQQARQHIYPRFAYSLLADYKKVLRNESPWQVLLSGALYLPGVHVNHNLVLTAAYQARDTLGEYVFTNNFPFSRGYEALNFPRMWMMGANYHFPICYPDWGFGHIVYFRRLRGNAFYDFTRVKSLRQQRTYDFRTVGLELFADTRWWNQLPLSIGLRYSRLLDASLVGASPNRWEIILPVNIL